MGRKEFHIQKEWGCRIEELALKIILTVRDGARYWRAEVKE
jgi:hypothetical protein